MAKILLTRGSQKLLAPHFKESEFFSRSSDAPSQHPFYSQLVDAAEYLRSQFGPWRITSTFRTERHERQLCEADGIPFITNSQHLIGRAFDSQPMQDFDVAMSELYSDFLRQGKHFKALRLLGITAFGIYDWGVHLDCRTEPGKQRDSFGTFAFWDKRTDVKKKPPTTKPQPKKIPVGQPAKARKASL